MAHTQTQAIVDWLLGPARTVRTLDEFVTTLAERLVAAGVPLDRALVSVGTLHAQHLSYGLLWRSNGRHHADTFDREEVPLGYFDRSPFRTVTETGAWVRLSIPETPDDLYDIIADLRRDGLVDYICAPVFASGTDNLLSWATARPSGFSPADIDLLKAIEPSLSAALEICALRRTIVDSLQTYLGDEPGQRVADGDIVRGEIGTVDAAILFADLRGFTARSMQMDNSALVRLLNEYFACLVPAIDQQGGDVLKLIGDGLLAIFRDRDGPSEVRALAAAREAQVSIAAANARGSEWPELVAGIALHHGTVAYGNIGAPRRLDFTVIGSDVNLASRICGVCRQAQAPILLSDAFRRRISAPSRQVGAYDLSGIDRPVTVFAPV